MKNLFLIDLPKNTFFECREMLINLSDKGQYILFER